jgi:hypothetical protein
LFTAVGARTGDVAKGHLRIGSCQNLRYVQRQVVGNAPICLLGHADGGYVQAEKASVVSNQLRFDGCQIEKIGMNNFAQLGVRHASGISIDHQNLLYLGMFQAPSRTPSPTMPVAPVMIALIFR